MSRIAGIVSSIEDNHREPSLERMLAASTLSDRYETERHVAGAAVFGWCGSKRPNIALISGMVSVMDGHIYNRSEFEESHETDAGLLAILCAKYGFAAALARINGDFAAGIYDPGNQSLWLARDRFGLKPLYYIMDGDRFAFASRIRALLGLPGVGPEVNKQFVGLFAGSHYRYFDNHPDESPYANVFQLPAAHVLRVANGRVSKSAYWSLQELADFNDSEAELCETYRTLLRDAVSLRLQPAPRAAFTLSGGMDSSSVLASAVQIAGAKQHAFSTVYTDKTYDESDEIQSMLSATVAHWHRVPVDCPNIFDLIGRMINVHDEPVATATWLSHFLLCEEASARGFGSLFGGLGGDELNAGEYEYFLYHFADLCTAGDSKRLAREVEMWIHYHDHPVFRKSPEVVEQGLSRLVDLSQPGRCLPDRHRLNRYAAALDRDYFDLETFEPIMDHPFRSYLKNRAYQDLTRETLPCCLRAEDRQTEAFGLDNFLPFLDYRVVEFMFRVPGAIKFRDGVTKHLLREAMRGVLPEETRTRVKKTGWNAPAHVWFSGSGRDRLLDLVHSSSFRERGVYNVPEVLRLIDEHDKIVASGESRENHMMFLWQLVNLELWLQAIPEIGNDNFPLPDRHDR
jgi:asparagine synthase (glutamine-hydrolysing)